MRLSTGVSLLWAAAALGWSQQYAISTFAGGAPPPTPIAAVNASIGPITGVATDSAGNVYFSSSLHCVFKQDSAGTLTRVAGTCRMGYSGDGGPATNAQLFYPAGLALDPAGNLYIADRSNNVIRKVSTSGIITTVNGATYVGYPEAVALDAAGNLYVAATYESPRIRKITPAGLVSTVAGTGIEGYSGDGGPATNAQLSHPAGLTLDGAGNLYIADAGNYRVRKVSTTGVITTVAGTSSYGFSGDGGPATSARLDVAMQGLAVDAAGNLYIADGNNCRIRQVTPAGIITTVAGSGTLGYSGDGGPATSAQLNIPKGVALDSAGNLYVADYGNFRLRKVSVSGLITTVAGDGSYAYSGDGGPATRAQLGSVQGVALDTDSNLYIADAYGHRIRKVTPGGLISTVAGSGAAGYSGDGGPAVSAQLSFPAGLALDPAGNLYVADRPANRIRKVSLGGVITTVAGTGTYGFSGDGGPATSAQLADPQAVTLDTAGNLYIADSGNSRVRRVTPGGLITTIAGTGYPGYFGEEMPAIYAQMSQSVNALVTDAADNLYLSDSGNGVVRKISTSGIITTVAGVTRYGPPSNSVPATRTYLSLPSGLAFDAAGDLYIAETQGHVWKVTPAGMITTVAGSQNRDYSGDGGPATFAGLGPATGLAMDATGHIYVGIGNYAAVRLLTPASTRADFNSDNVPDLIWQNDATRQVSVWYLGGPQGNSHLGEAWLAPTGPLGWSVVGTADFNGDGKPDLVWQNDTTRQVAVWYMGGAQGTQFLGDAWLAQTGPQGWRLAALSDLNRDGKPDLLWQNDTTRQVTVWYMGGAQGAQLLGDAWLAQEGPLGWRLVGVAELNADGRLDLVWQHDTTRRVAVWYLGGNQGTTHVGDSYLALNGPQGWLVVGLADLDQDGHPDLLWQNEVTRQIAVWYLGGVLGNQLLSDGWITSNGVPGSTATAR